jgi:hypothetical protein
LRVLNRAFDQPLELEERAADPLAGGLMRGYQCGMIWGAALAAGALAYRTLGKGPQAEAWAIVAAQRIVHSFRAQNKSMNCRDITGIDMAAATPRMIVHFLIKSAPTGSCFGKAARYAHAAFREIDIAFSEAQPEVPSATVSCAAMLAQKMGASDLHTVMAAGLAGGIGLSGGACGALGAALWIDGMKSPKASAGEMSLQSPGVSDVIERFIKCSDHKFECSQIVGRKFESVADHANYLRTGGCSEIIEVLAAQKERI